MIVDARLERRHTGRLSDVRGIENGKVRATRELFGADQGMKRREDDMTRVLLVGLRPEAVDYSDPALPPGMNAEKIQAGLALALEQMTDRGWHADACLIDPDATAGPTVERQLSTTTYDCVVIGGGIRLPPRNLRLLETVINAVHNVAPSASIAFNTRPEDSADSAARWLSSGDSSQTG
jgi:hypothetical protein